MHVKFVQREFTNCTIQNCKLVQYKKKFSVFAADEGTNSETAGRTAIEKCKV